MPYQKKLQKTYGSIESQVQPGSSYNNGGVGDGGGFGNPSKYNLSNNNNNVSFIFSMQEFILLAIIIVKFKYLTCLTCQNTLFRIMVFLHITMD